MAPRACRRIKPGRDNPPMPARPAFKKFRLEPITKPSRARGLRNSKAWALWDMVIQAEGVFACLIRLPCLKCGRNAAAQV